MYIKMQFFLLTSFQRETGANQECKMGVKGQSEGKGDVWRRNKGDNERERGKGKVGMEERREEK